LGGGERGGGGGIFRFPGFGFGFVGGGRTMWVAVVPMWVGRPITQAPDEGRVQSGTPRKLYSHPEFDVASHSGFLGDSGAGCLFFILLIK
jgi:hypothetical protein